MDATCYQPKSQGIAKTGLVGSPSASSAGRPNHEDDGNKDGMACPSWKTKTCGSISRQNNKTFKLSGSSETSTLAFGPQKFEWDQSETVDECAIDDSDEIDFGTLAEDCEPAVDEISFERRDLKANATSRSSSLITLMLEDAPSQEPTGGMSQTSAGFAPARQGSLTGITPPPITRRKILETELEDDLRRCLFHERQQASLTANAVLRRRYPRTT